MGVLSQDWEDPLEKETATHSHEIAKLDTTEPLSTQIISFYILFKVCACMHACCAQSPQSSPTLRDAMDYSLPGSSVHGILQARILEWVVIPFSGDLPLPGIEPASLMFFTTCTIWEAFYSNKFYLNIRLYIPLALFYFSRCQKLGWAWRVGSYQLLG